MIISVREYPVPVPADLHQGILAEIRVPAGAELLDVFIRVENAPVIERYGREPFQRHMPVLVYRIREPVADPELLPRRLLFVPIGGDVTAPGEDWRYIRLVKLPSSPTFALFESTLHRSGDGDVIDAASMPVPKKLRSPSP